MSEVSMEQKVIGQSAEAATLLAGFTAKAAARLNVAAVAQSGDLSTEEMEKRVGAALAILRGEPPITQKEQPAAVGKTPRKSNELDKLRQEGRVHGKEAYEKLGIKVASEPEISKEILEQCRNAPVKSMIVLDMGRSLIDLADASKGGWTMILGDLAKTRDFAKETHSSPQWVVVPMKNCEEPRTLGLSKASAISVVQNSPKGVGLEIVAPDPRHQAIGILLHQRDTGEKLFKYKYTFTNKPNVVVGDSRARYFRVYVDGLNVDASGADPVALAPSGIKKS
jgi:hypothetical protein